MIKPSPNPPTSESEENTGTSNRPCPIFTIRPGINSETLLVHAYETLASANVKATELSSMLTGPHLQSGTRRSADDCPCTAIGERGAGSA